MPPQLCIVPLQLYCVHAGKRKRKKKRKDKKRKRQEKKTLHKSWKGRLCFSKKKWVRMAALCVYTLPFRKTHKHQAPSINEDIKKALANSTGKLSLGEGPAQTGSRAGFSSQRPWKSSQCEGRFDFHCTSTCNKVVEKCPRRPQRFPQEGFASKQHPHPLISGKKNKTK